MQNGLYQIVLPFVDNATKKPKPTEEVIHEVLSTTTIPIYSEFVPNNVIGTADVKDLKVIDERNGVYLLPAHLTYTEVKSVIDVRFPFINNRGVYGDLGYLPYGAAQSPQGTLTGMAYLMLSGEMRNEPTFEYLGNNKVRLCGFPKTILEFELGCEHDPNGETIPSTCYDSFMELANLDVQSFLWNTLRHYEELPTAFGTIKINSQDWQSAEDKRKALLDDWRDKFHVDQASNFSFM